MKNEIAYEEDLRETYNDTVENGLSFYVCYNKYGCNQ